MRACCVLVVLLGLSSFVAAQPENKVLNKTREEWLGILKDHKEVKFRRAALIALTVFGPRSAGVLPAMSDALVNDADPLVRQEAAMLLGQMGADAKAAVFSLGDAMLKDKSEKVREAAAQALAGKLNMFAEEQVATLTNALKDPHPGTRVAAAEALLKLGDKAAPAVPALVDLAKDSSKDRFSRQYAVKALCRLAPDRLDVASIMIEILGDKSAAVPLRQDACEGLARMTVSADKVIPPLVEHLGDPQVEIRRAVAAALAKQGKDAKGAWPKIRPALKDGDQAVRYQILRLAGQIAREDSEPVAELIHHAEKDANAENRLAAIQELGELSIHRPLIEPVLVRLQEGDPSTAIRETAEAALKKLRM